MGCFLSHQIHATTQKSSSNVLMNFEDTTLLICTDSESCRMISKIDKESIDEIIIEVGTLFLPVLAYAIVKKDLAMVKALHKDFGASFETMGKKLELQGSSIFELLITNYDEPILDYYITNNLEQYITCKISLDTLEQDCTLNFLSIEIPKPKKHSKLPILYAVEVGCIDFLSYMIKKFSGKKAPTEFNIHSIDEVTGENAALIACRTCNLKLITFLKKQKVDFSIRNKCHESAIHIALAGEKCCTDKDVLAVVTLLVENIKVDITHNIEETLLLAKDQCVIEYLEGQLADRGYYITKQQVEANNNISFSYSAMCSPLKVDQESQASLISSISYGEFINTPNQIVLNF